MRATESRGNQSYAVTWGKSYSRRNKALTVRPKSYSLPKESTAMRCGAIGCHAVELSTLP